MGQVLYYPPTVEGWEGGPAWITSSTLLARYNVAGRLLLGAEVDPARPNLLLPPALAWVPIKKSVGARKAEFSSMDWLAHAGAADARMAIAVMKKAIFLRTGLSSPSLPFASNHAMGKSTVPTCRSFHIPEVRGVVIATRRKIYLPARGAHRG